MEKGKISIVIPIFNSIKCLDGCLQSILKQTYRNIEVIMVDDGSEDGSTELCEWYEKRHDNFRLFVKENEGVSSARNFGMDKATGEFLQFVDSDDKLLPTSCEMLIRKMKERRQCDVVIGGFSRTSDGRLVIPKDAYYDDMEALGIDFGLYYHMSNNSINAPWNKLYRRKHLKARFPKDLSKGEDLLFNLDVLSSAQGICFFEYVVYEYNDDNAGSLAHYYRQDGFEIEERLHNEVYDFIMNYISRLADKSYLWVNFLDGVKARMKELVKCSGKEMHECKDTMREWLKHDSVQKMLCQYQPSGIKDKVLIQMMKWNMTQLLYFYYSKLA